MLESFAYGVRHHLEVLAEHGVRPARARVTNGGASSPLWKQIVADVDRASCSSPSSTTRARRSARPSPPAWAAARSREWSEIGRFVGARRAHRARASGRGGVYDERYRAYRALYEALKPAA